MLAAPPPPPATLDGLVYEFPMKYADLTELAADWDITQGEGGTVSAGATNPVYGENCVQLTIVGDGDTAAETRASLEQTFSGLTPGARCWATFEYYADGHWFEWMSVRLTSGTATKSKRINPPKGSEAGFGETATPLLTIQGGGSVTARIEITNGYPIISHNDVFVIGRFRFFVSDEDVEEPIEDVEFFRTSFRRSITYQDSLYTPCEIEHTEPTWGVEDQPGTIQISLPSDDPIARMLTAPLPPSIPMVAIYQYHRPPTDEPDPANVRSSLYEIKSAEDTGTETTLTCESILGQGDVVVPSGLAQRDYCTFATYDPETCGVNPASYTFQGEVTDIDGLSVTVADASGFGGADPTFFYLGSFSKGIYYTMIAEQIGDVMTLDEMIPGLVVGDLVTLLAGDLRTKEVCATKFFNSARRLSFPDMPTTNPYYGQGLR